MSLFLGLFKKIGDFPESVNGLADPLYPANFSGTFRQLYEKDYGLINSTYLSTIGFDDTDFASRSLFRSPGKYTGEMRKVIQALYSHGKPCGYDYKHGLCHGVYTAGDNSKWVIQISSSGILAAPLPIIIPHITELDWLGYTPDYDVDLFDPGNLDIIDLADSTVVADFYAKNYLFFSCGWAFNSNGSEAQNTCVDVDSGYRYKISIGDDGVSPNSAIMSLVESGVMKFSNINGIKVPAATEDKFESIDSFTLTAEGTYEGPLYVFYDGMTEKVVRSKHAAEGAPEAVNESISFVALTVGGINLPLFTDEGNGTYRVGTLTRRTDGTYIDGVTVNETIYGTSLKTTVHTLIAHDANYIPNSVYTAAPNVHTSRGDSRTQTGEVETHVYACIVPLWEREAVYQYKWKHESASSKTFGWAYCNDSASSQSVSSLPAGCYRVTNIYGVTNSLSYLYRQNLREHEKLVINSIFCVSDPIISPSSGSGSYSADAINEATLSIIGSGGVDELIWTDGTVTTEETVYNNIPDPEADQWIYACFDSTKINTIFCDSEMNSGNKFILNVDEAKYPIDTLTVGVHNFWVGEP